MFEVRAALEGFAARLAALRATEAELEGIRAIHQTYIDTVRGSNRGHLVEHNDESTRRSLPLRVTGLPSRFTETASTTSSTASQGPVGRKGTRFD